MGYVPLLHESEPEGEFGIGEPALVHGGELVGPNLHGGLAVVPLASPEYPAEERDGAHGHHERCGQGEDDDQQPSLAHVPVLCTSSHGWTCTSQIKRSGQMKKQPQGEPRRSKSAGIQE
jgi:hypothetical protein